MIRKGIISFFKPAQCRNILAWMCLVGIAGSFAAIGPLFWEQEIKSALDSRDAFYKSAGIRSDFFAGLHSRQNTFRLFQSIPQDSTSTWYYFLKGLAVTKDSAEIASLFFNKALVLTEKDPGSTWVLCSEFERHGFYLWQEKSLKKLEELFLASGAQSAPVVAQPLLFKAVFPGASHRTNTPEFYCSWAEKFDKNSIWPALIKIKSGGIFNLGRTIATVEKIIGKIASSWRLQLVLSRHLFAWFFSFIIFCIVGILVGIGAKHLPSSLHIASEYLPSLFSSKAKLFLVFCVFCSVAFFGALPFLWCFFFIIWRHCRRRDKRLLGLALALFLLFPIGIRVGDMFDRALSPEGPVMLYKKVIDEGYYSSLDSCIAAQTRLAGGDFLLHTAAALYSLKKGDPVSAYPHIKLAQRSSPYNPAVIIASGNAKFYHGDLSGARNAYQQCIKLYPSYEPAYFNLGQYFFNSMETAKGMEYITQAAKLNPVNINAFIKKNDECFSKEWPPLCQLIAPDFNPAQFWNAIFPFYCGSWKTATERFGGLFLGVPLLWYCGIEAALLVLLLCFDVLVWSKDILKKVSACKLCQAPICRACKRGGVCKNCFNDTQHIRNEQIRQRIMRKIQNRTVGSGLMIAHFLDMLFPGAGIAYRGSPVYKSLPVIAATALVYATYASLLHSTSEYPSWIFQGATIPLYCLLVFYNMFFIVRAIMKSVKELKMRGA
jgi:tetratricopeptide (TPR) repeat protein